MSNCIAIFLSPYPSSTNYQFDADSQAKPGPSLREQKERRMAERRRRKMRRKRRKQLSRRRLKASMNKIRASMSKITFNKTAVVIEASNATYGRYC